MAQKQLSLLPARIEQALRAIRQARGEAIVVGQHALESDLFDLELWLSSVLEDLRGGQGAGPAAKIFRAYLSDRMSHDPRSTS